jgi:hypothetical protein
MQIDKAIAIVFALNSGKSGKLYADLECSPCSVFTSPVVRSTLYNSMFKFLSICPTCGVGKKIDPLKYTEYACGQNFFPP